MSDETYNHTNEPNGSFKRQLFIMRHAERVDLTFENWMSTCFTKEGKYIRNDLNLPKTLPDRANYPTNYADDTPITNLGVFESKLTGEALAAAGVKIKYVFSSPALRSVQTCDNVLQGLGIRDTAVVRIEPALFEWLMWYHPKVPVFLTDDEFLKAGFKLDTSYKPFISREKLQEHIKETCEQYYQRSYNFIQKLLADTEGDDGNILIVAHGPALDACTRQLRGLPPRTAPQLGKILHKVHYCNIIRSYPNETSWKIAESPSPSFTNMGNPTFNWKVLLE